MEIFKILYYYIKIRMKIVEDYYILNLLFQIFYYQFGDTQILKV